MTATCDYPIRSCDREGTHLVRERPPGNPFRDVRTCEDHASEMIGSGYYFNVGGRLPSFRSHEPPRNSGEGTAVDGPMPLGEKPDADAPA